MVYNSMKKGGGMIQGALPPSEYKNRQSEGGEGDWYNKKFAST
jgi:hypothetical protein